MSPSIETPPRPRGRPRLVPALPAQDAGAPAMRPRTIGPALWQSWCGPSENTIRRIHAEEIAAGRPGFLIKCGRSTLLDLDAWGRWVERQPPAHMLSDRKATAA